MSEGNRLEQTFRDRPRNLVRTLDSATDAFFAESQKQFRLFPLAAEQILPCCTTVLQTLGPSFLISVEARFSISHIPFFGAGIVIVRAPAGSARSQVPLNNLLRWAQ